MDSCIRLTVVQVGVRLVLLVVEHPPMAGFVGQHQQAAVTSGDLLEEPQRRRLPCPELPFLQVRRTAIVRLWVEFFGGANSVISNP